MKQHYNLFSNGMIFLAALILLGIGILTPQALLALQEREILASRHEQEIQVQELSESQKQSNPNMEYQRLLYRLLAWEYFLLEIDELEEPEDYELSRENALNKVQQELLRLIDIGALPQINLEEYEPSDITLYGGKIQDGILLEEMRYLGVENPSQFFSDARVSRWNITLSRKDAANGRIAIEMDAQTGKIYSCHLFIDFASLEKDLGNKNLSNQAPFMYGQEEAAARLFAEYHGLLQYWLWGENSIDSTSVESSEGRYSIQTLNYLQVACSLGYEYAASSPTDIFWYTLRIYPLSQ